MKLLLTILLAIVAIVAIGCAAGVRADEPQPARAAVAQQTSSSLPSVLASLPSPAHVPGFARRSGLRSNSRVESVAAVDAQAQQEGRFGGLAKRIINERRRNAKVAVPAPSPSLARPAAAVVNADIPAPAAAPVAAAAPLASQLRQLKQDRLLAKQERHRNFRDSRAALMKQAAAAAAAAAPAPAAVAAAAPAQAAAGAAPQVDSTPRLPASLLKSRHANDARTNGVHMARSDKTAMKRDMKKNGKQALRSIRRTNKKLQ